MEFTVLANTDPNYYPLTMSNMILTDLSGNNIYTGYQNGMLQVTASDDDPPEAASLRLSSSTLDFGILRPSDSLELELVLYNDGELDLELRIP